MPAWPPRDAATLSSVANRTSAGHLSSMGSIVGFIRTRPRIPSTRKGAIPRDVADAPISFKTRRRDEVIVHLRTGVATGEEVTMVRREGSWLIINHGMWIS